MERGEAREKRQTPFDGPFRECFFTAIAEHGVRWSLQFALVCGLWFFFCLHEELSVALNLLNEMI